MNEPQNETPGKISESDLLSLASHEIGHVLICYHLSIPAVPTVELADDGTLVSGWCFREFTGNVFEAACVGWGGVMAEHLVNRIVSWRTPLPWKLTELSINEWVDAVLFYGPELSKEDRNHINGYWDTLKSAKFTFQILNHNRERLDKLAIEFATVARKQIEEKVAARRELDELKKLAASLATNPPKSSIAYRAACLVDLLASLPADDPQRALYAPLLACLQRGGEPPADMAAELERK